MKVDPSLIAKMEEGNFTKASIGNTLQEYIAIIIQSHFPKEEYPNLTVRSNVNNGCDIEISNGNGISIRGEVKSALELFEHSYFNKKTQTFHSNIRRGKFKTFKSEMVVDFFVFITRFVDYPKGSLDWNGYIEIFYCLTEDLKEVIDNKFHKFYKGKEDYLGYGLCIEKIHEIKTLTDNFAILKPILLNNK